MLAITEFMMIRFRISSVLLYVSVALAHLYTAEASEKRVSPSSSQARERRPGPYVHILQARKKIKRATKFLSIVRDRSVMAVKLLLFVDALVEHVVRPILYQYAWLCY